MTRRLAAAVGSLVGAIAVHAASSPTVAPQPLAPAPAGEPNGVETIVPTDRPEPVAVSELAGALGLEPVWTEPGKKLRLASPGSELLFENDRREVRVNGVRVFMGEGTSIAKQTLMISPIDRDRLLLPILAPQQIEARDPVHVVVVDPGHGGRDNGTRNDELGLLEKDFTLDVARRLKPRLAARGFEVVLTREDDTYIPRPERPARAAAVGADVFVSIHFNATPSSDVRGLETYVLTSQYQRSTGNGERRPEDDIAVPGNRFDKWSAYLGYTLHRILLADLELPDRGLKRARFDVLRDLPCPGLLVEGGFLTHPEEAKLVASEAYREALADAIAKGIDVYNQTLKRLAATRPTAPASADGRGER